jgi:hypothetical protein
MDLNSAAEQRGIILSAFGGIVRLTNFLSLRFKNLSLTNKLVVVAKIFRRQLAKESGLSTNSWNFQKNPVFHDNFHPKERKYNMAPAGRRIQ